MATLTGYRTAFSRSLDHGKDNQIRIPILYPEADLETGNYNIPARVDKQRNSVFLCLSLLLLVLISSGTFFAFHGFNNVFSKECAKVNVPQPKFDEQLEDITRIPTTTISSHETSGYVDPIKPAMPHTFDEKHDNSTLILTTTISSYETGGYVGQISPETSHPFLVEANLSTRSPGVYATIEIWSPTDLIRLETNNGTTIDSLDIKLLVDDSNSDYSDLNESMSYENNVIDRLNKTQVKHIEHIRFEGWVTSNWTRNILTTFSEVTNLTIDINALCPGAKVRDADWDSLQPITLHKVKYLQMHHSFHCSIVSWCLRWDVQKLEHLSIKYTLFNHDIFTAFVTFLEKHKNHLKSVFLFNNYFCPECNFSDDLIKAVGIKVKDSVQTEEDLNT